jgi:hypothetical protein
MMVEETSANKQERDAGVNAAAAEESSKDIHKSRVILQAWHCGSLSSGNTVQQH